MKTHTPAERAMVKLFNQIEDGLGDSLRMTERLLEGARMYPGDRAAGVSEMVLGYEAHPICELDEDGYPEEGQENFNAVRVRLSVRERGVSDGDEVIIDVPRDWAQPLSSQDDAKLEEWFERAGAVVGVTMEFGID